jgi:putative flippase GtrA
MRVQNAYRRYRDHGLVGQFVRYAVVGAFNLIAFLALFNLLHLAGLHPIAAYVTAFVPVNVMAFFLNKRWAFRDTRTHAVHLQYLRFAFFTLMALGLNTGAFALFLIPLGRYGTIGRNMAALAPLPLSVAWSFTTYRLWTFEGGVSSERSSLR